jgi:hypothetical protein
MADGVAPEEVARATVQEALDALRHSRPVFYSEADLQHALAWEFHGHNPRAKIRLEVPLLVGGKEYLDLFVAHEELRLAIELKFPRAPFRTEHEGEPIPYVRNSPDAVDDTRYAVVGDLKRLERLVDEGAADVGCLLLLTNGAAYWNPPVRPVATLDAAFRLHEGSIVGGVMPWAERGRLKATITLRGEYTARWQDYSQLPPPATGSTTFRYLAIFVT